MFGVRDDKLLSKSEKAEKHFRQLQLWDRICLILLGLMTIGAIWNIYMLWSLLDGTPPDLQDLINFREGAPARALLILAGAAILAFIYKEWRYGERSLGMMYFVVPWLFLVLVPVMMDELIGETADQVPSLSVSSCQPGSLASGAPGGGDACEFLQGDQLELRLTIANPAERDVTLREPISIRDHRTNWSIAGRGDYTIYFLLEQESLQVCEQSLAEGTFLASSPARGEVGTSFCHEQDGSAWVVAPLSTNYLSSPLMDFYFEEAP